MKAKNCKLQLDIHFIKKTERWSVVWVYNLHSHPQNPDPFIYTSYQSCHPGHQKAVELATTHHDELSYAESSQILMKSGVNVLEQKKFYNLEQEDCDNQLIRTKELKLLLKALYKEDFQVQINEHYVLNESDECYM